jgi:hypothetical protein
VSDEINLSRPSLEARQRQQGIRVCRFFYQGGTGVRTSPVRFEVLHACGEWAWAHYRFCGHCGEPLQVAEHHRNTIVRNSHRDHCVIAGVKVEPPERPGRPTRVQVEAFNRPLAPAAPRKPPAPT